MVSEIDATKPVGPIAYTADVRNNFAIAASEISALQAMGPGSGGGGGQSNSPGWVDATDYGAVFDGNSHPLSTQFSTLTAAQAVYPHAVALTDEIDGVAIQAAINDLAARVTNYSYGGEVRIPAGLGLMNQPLFILQPTISLRAPGGGFEMRAVVDWTIPSTTTMLKWTGAPRTPGQGQINMLTVQASNRRLIANNILNIMFDCNSIAGCAGPLFNSVAHATIDIAVHEPRGIAYPAATLTAGSQMIIVPGAASGVRIGESIVSASLPEGAYVASITGTTITASVQALANSTETVTIGGEGVRFELC